jgi:glycosyltransferase involved in cell wall biosynthesis
MTAALTRPRMLALVGDLSGPTLWRVLQPTAALQDRGYPAEWDFRTAPAIEHAPRAFDGFVLPRLAWPSVAQRLVAHWFDLLHAAGKFVVFDLDDDILTFADTARRIELGWTEGRSFDQLEAARAARVWALRRCDGVTVSTEPLAEVVRSFTARPVVVVPNAIDLPWLRTVLRRALRRTRGVTIGWAGGMRSGRDLAPVAEAWRRIAERFPSVTFVVQGHPDPGLLAAVPSDRLLLLPWLPLDRYPEGLVEVDIACCAVAADRWNANKSPIKAYEAAVAGAAVVATPTVYGSLIADGLTGYLAETASDWTRALADLVEHPALRSMMARRLLRVVEREHALARNVGAWPAAWAAIAEDAAERRRDHAGLVVARA